MNIFISSSIHTNLKDTINLANELNLNIELREFSDPRILNNNFKNTLNVFKSLIKDFDGKISMHAAFSDLNCVSSDEKIKELTLYRYNQAVEAATTLKAETIIFHTGYNNFGKAFYYREKFIKKRIKFWNDFLNTINNENITLALENTFEETPNIINEIINKVNNNNFKACIDTGHANIFSSINICDWIKTLDKNLGHIHIHNNYGKVDEHNSILSGTIDFIEIFQILKDKKLSPNIVIEVFNKEKSLESLDALKKILSTLQ